MNIIRSLQLASLASLTAVVAQAVVIDFTGTTSFTDNFNAASGMSLSPTGGVGSGQGVNIGGSSPAFYKGTTDAIPDLNVGDSVTMGLFFQRAESTVPEGGARITALGLSTSGDALDSNTGGLGTAVSGQGNFGLIIQLNGATASGVTAARLRTFDSASGAAPTNSGFLKTFNLTNNTWYKFEATFTMTATDNTWSVSSTLQDWGTTGTSFVGDVFTLSPTIVASSGAGLAYDDTQLFAGFSGASTHAKAVDNFSLTTTSAIPEPSTYAALVGLGALGFVALRRRTLAR